MVGNFKPIVYTKKNSSEDISKKFIEYVVKLTNKIYKDYYKKPKPYNLTVEEEKEFQSASTCHICEEEFSRDEKSNGKVRDHCHFTGEYRGAAHNQCNLSCRKPMILPVIFYNLQGYDAHLFAWDACLKLTKQELQRLTDYDMLMMFEKGIRGGISHISKRYAEANNKYMKDFDKTKPSTFIQYLDANNLYGWAMSQKLLTHGFKWMDINIPSVLKLL